MGAFSDIFGDVPKILILEMFAESPNDELSIRDIIDQTGVSKRGAYLIVKKFKDSGLLVEFPGRPHKYMLNHNDLRVKTLIRAEPLLIMGKLEYELKLENNVDITEPFKLEEDFPTRIVLDKQSNSFSEYSQTGEIENEHKEFNETNEQIPMPIGA
jgi:hypothetical protein